MRNTTIAAILLLVMASVSACRGTQKPNTPQPAPAAPSTASAVPDAGLKPAAPTTRVDEPLPVPAVPDVLTGGNLDDINRNSPFKPALFVVDSADLDDLGRAVVTSNAEIMRKNPRWIITIEGHCDERGTAEYNLSLGERRAVAVKTYLVSLGIPESRIRTVSYGKEFPFAAGHDDSSWAQNRRAHFVVTSTSTQ